MLKRAALAPDKRFTHFRVGNKNVNQDNSNLANINAIPLGATGKMQKNKLREQLANYKLPTA